MITEDAWKYAVSAVTGLVGGGWFVKFMITRQLKQLDSASDDIHSIKTDIAVIKEKMSQVAKLEDRVQDNHEKILRLEGKIDSINKSGCQFKQSCE